MNRATPQLRLLGRPFSVVSGHSDERRLARRYPYPAHVLIERRQAQGCDISPTGLAVRLGEPLPVGQTVLVTLGWGTNAEDHIAAHARVVRVAPADEGFTVCFQFAGLHPPAPPS